MDNLKQTKKFNAEEINRILEQLAILVVGLVYKDMEDEVCQIHKTVIKDINGLITLDVNFDWWLPFYRIDIRKIKSVVLLGLKGMDIGVDSHQGEIILLKNGQRILIGRREFELRQPFLYNKDKSPHGISIIFES